MIQLPEITKSLENPKNRNSPFMTPVGFPDVANGSTWLDIRARANEFSPKVVGDNYQPLGTRWFKRKIDSNFGDRTSHQVVSFYDRHGVRAFFLGGWCTKRRVRLNDVLAFTDINSPCKQTRSSCEWSPRCQFSALSDFSGSHIYVLGGDDGSIKSDVWLSRDGCRSFMLQTLSTGWAQRIGFSSVVVGSSTLVVCGGRDTLTLGGPFFNDVWVSVNKGVDWSICCNKAPWKSRAFASMLYVNDTILLAGGIGEVSAFDDVWSSVDLGTSWTLVSIKHVPWKPRRSFSFVQDPISSELLIFGGANSDGASLSDSWASLDLGVTWIPRPPLPTEDFVSPSCIMDINGRLFLVEASNQQRVYESVSELRFVKQDCMFLLLLGQHLRVSKETWVGQILPFAIDTRQLWKRNSSEWAALN